MRDKFTIEMFPLLNAEGDGISGARLLRATDDSPMREIAETFARYLKTEERYDFPTFTADATNQEVYLMTSKRIRTLTPIAIGAAGFHLKENELGWVWLHPFERGQGLMGEVWSQLQGLHGNEFTVQQPISAAMEAFLRHHKVEPARWGGRTS